MIENSWQSLKQITSYQSTKLEKMVKFYVPTWTLFAGPVTYYYSPLNSPSNDVIIEIIRQLPIEL